MTTGKVGSREFVSLHDAVETACYIEELLAAEHQWITNRLSWLFVSQSFLVVAFVTLITSPLVAPSNSRVVKVLTWGLPIVGFITCFFVALGIYAAHHEAKKLANARATVTIRINTFIPLRIPLIGVAKGLRDSPRTQWLGASPHMVLPWVLVALWAVLLWAVFLGL